MPFPTKRDHLYVFPYTHCCFVYLNVHVCCYIFFSIFFLNYSALCVFKSYSCYFVQTSSLLLTVAKHFTFTDVSMEPILPPCAYAQ